MTTSAVPGPTNGYGDWWLSSSPKSARAVGGGADDDDDGDWVILISSSHTGSSRLQGAIPGVVRRA